MGRRRFRPPNLVSSNRGNDRYHAFPCAAQQKERHDQNAGNLAPSVKHLKFAFPRANERGKGNVMTGTVANTDLLYAEREGIATITINWPVKLNAFQGKTCDELTEALNRSAWNSGIGMMSQVGIRKICPMKPLSQATPSSLKLNLVIFARPLQRTVAKGSASFFSGYIEQ